MDRGRDGRPLKVLVIKPSALGDIVHGLPFLDALKGGFPQARVHWVAARGLHDILVGHPLIERLWVFDKERWKAASRLRETAGEMMRFFSEMHREAFDLVVDLQGLFRSGFMALATGAPIRVGFREAREGSRFFYTHQVEGGREIHAIDRYMKVAEFLGCGGKGGPRRFPFPPLPEDTPVMHGLPQEGYAVIAPAAGGRLKVWPAERFGAVAARLPMPSVVVAGKADAHLAWQVVRASAGKAVSLAGKTGLRELAAIIRGARLMVSPDTGPMHIAAAFHVPAVALFGPTNPVRTGPYGKIHTIVRADSPCSPCYKRKHCGAWKCMEAISVEMVLEAIGKAGCSL